MKTSPHAIRAGELDILPVISRAPDADLHHALGVEQPFLHGAAERRAMREFESAEIAVVEIRMAIEINHADRPVFGNRAQDRQARQMIAADRHRRDVSLHEFAIKARDALQRVVETRRVDGDIAKVSAAGEVKGHDARSLVQLTHHGGGVAQRTGPVPRAGAIGRSPVPGDAHEADVDAFDPRILQRHVGQPHKGRDAREARQHKT